MAIAYNNDVHNLFVVMNSAAVDLANHTAVASVDTTIDVEGLDGVEQYPLNSTVDHVVAVTLPITIEAGITVQTAVVTDHNTITLRTTNASAGAINPASIDAGSIKFLIARR
jgi:hypothetical protein